MSAREENRALGRKVSGSRSRRKGPDGEREIVVLARQHGLKAQRTWHLAESPDPAERACDINVAGLRAQVKIAANEFKGLYDALDGVEVAFLRADRRPWLPVVPAERLIALVASSNGATDEAAHHVWRRKGAAGDSRATCPNRRRHCQLYREWRSVARSEPKASDERSVASPR